MRMFQIQADTFGEACMEHTSHGARVDDRLKPLHAKRVLRWGRDLDLQRSPIEEPTLAVRRSSNRVGPIAGFRAWCCLPVT